jgi:hypothetical protein
MPTRAADKFSRAAPKDRKQIIDEWQAHSMALQSHNNSVIHIDRIKKATDSTLL